MESTNTRNLSVGISESEGGEMVESDDGGRLENVNDEETYVGEEGRKKDGVISSRVFSACGETSFPVPSLGKEFESEQHVMDFYNAYAFSVGFSVRKAEIRREHDGSVFTRRWVCWREGFRAKKHLERVDRKRKERRITRVGCHASLKAKKGTNGKWVIIEFVEQHNHEMVPLCMVHLLGSHKHLDDAAQAQAYMVKNAGDGADLGMSNVSQENHEAVDANSLERDLVFVQQKPSRKGDTQILLDYFVQTKVKDPNFFYAIRVDGEGRMINFFWADARSRMDYDYFGDLVIFDTAYKMKQYNLPFASFTGVNHNRQTVLFGCALLLDEAESSFIWLFETWMKAMFGHHPVSIVIDQNPAIEGAIKKVLPRTCYRFCLWHIFESAAKKLAGAYREGNGFAMKFSECINMEGTIDEFESCWNSLVDEYDLKENHWLQLLYTKRQQWVPLYLQDAFFANTSTTQRSRRMKPFFDGFVHSHTNLQDFVNRYEGALTSQREKEIEEDFKTVHTQPVLKTVLKMEEEAAKIYTRSSFEIFQQELIKRDNCIAEKIEEKETSCKYKVTEYKDDRATCKIDHLTSKNENMAHVVDFDASGTRANCSCKMFESEGILCKHILWVFRISNIMTLPSQYIMKRWTRGAKSECGIRTCGASEGSVTLQYNDLLRLAQHIAVKGATSADTYELTKLSLLHTLKQLEDMAKSGSMPVVDSSTLTTTNSHHGNMNIEVPTYPSTSQMTLQNSDSAKTKKNSKKKCRSCEVHNNKCNCLALGVGGASITHNPSSPLLGFQSGSTPGYSNAQPCRETVIGQNDLTIIGLLDGGYPMPHDETLHAQTGVYASGSTDDPPLQGLTAGFHGGVVGQQPGYSNGFMNAMPHACFHPYSRSSIPNVGLHLGQESEAQFREQQSFGI